MNSKPVAISVKDAAKYFKLPHERYNSLKQNAIHLFSRKNFEKMKALEGVSFEVNKGEFFGIVGRNGSGKSTLLKLLAKIYVPSKGNVIVNGSLSPFIELGVGFNPELTARDNVYLNGAILGLTRKEIDSRFDEIFGFAELEDFMDQKLKNFSSGMQVRLAFSIAIQIPADILLIDEVLAVGDASFQTKCLDTFYRLKKEGKTIVFVSHDMEMVKEFCDRALVIHKGKQIYCGDTEKAAQKYYQFSGVSGPEEAENTTDEYALPDKKAAITNIWIENEKGAEVSAVEGEVFSICMSVLFNDRCVDPVPGVIIFNQDEMRISASNTQWASTKTGEFAKGTEAVFKFTYSNFLEAGRYKVSANIVHSDLKNVYDWEDKRLTILSKRKYLTGGIVNPKYEVTISTK